MNEKYTFLNIKYKKERKFMISDSIACETKLVTFLAVTEIMPFEPEVPRKSAKKIEVGRETLLRTFVVYDEIQFDLEENLEKGYSRNLHK